MVKIIIGIVVVVWLATMFVSSSKEEDRQALRTSEQAQLLTQLEALRTPAVSKLVDEWRKEYPAPSEQRLTELKVLAERVKADPKNAEKYTAESRQKRFDDMPFSSPLGTPKAKPGIDG